jgi:uncharacterized protein YqgV (UPF0045/DUF77 family)
MSRPSRRATLGSSSGYGAGASAVEEHSTAHGYAPAVPLQLEFTVEPFEPGSPGPHVRAAEEAARAAAGGAELSVGPFGTSLSGPSEAVLAAVASVVRAALEAGATRVTLQVSAADPP